VLRGTPAFRQTAARITRLLAAARLVGWSFPEVGARTLIADEVTSRLLADYDAGLLTQYCAWCGRVAVDDNDWQPAPRLALLAIDDSTVTHGICPDCTPALPTRSAV
jgi:hypothetical protein